MNLRLLSTDFDGTLMDHGAGGTPPPPDFFDRLAAFRKEAPLTWVINTGRRWEDLVFELEAKAFPVWPDWVVLIERRIFRVENKTAIPFEEWNEPGEVAHTDLYSKTEHLFKKIEAFVTQNTKASVIEDIGSPIGLISSTEEEADKIAAFLDQLLADWPDLVYVRNSVWFRFSHRDYNKGTSMTAIARHLGISSDSILAAGDHCNDLPMLDSQHARGLVCPANAVHAVKEKVSLHGGYVAKTNAALGVLEGWNHFFPLPTCATS